MTDDIYRPVYLFTVTGLFDSFLRQIPHEILAEPFTRDDRLRNRNLRGQRVGHGQPGRPILANAYRNEIVGLGNGKLATFLFANWIKLHPQPLTEALNVLGINDDPQAAIRWLPNAQASLRQLGHEAAISRIVRRLVPSFDPLTIHVVVATLSYEYPNQEALHSLVETEIQLLSADLQVAEERHQQAVTDLAERKRLLEHTLLADDEAYKSDESTRRHRLAEVHVELATLLQERDDAQRELASKEEYIAGLQNDVEVLRTRHRDLENKYQKQLRLRAHLDSEAEQCDQTRQDKRASIVEQVNEIDMQLSSVQQQLVSIQEQLAEAHRLEEERIQQAAAAPPAGTAPSEHDTQVEKELLVRFMHLVTEQNFVSSTATLSILHDRLKHSTEHPRLQTGKPGHVSLDKAVEWARYYAYCASQPEERWNRATLANYALWKTYTPMISREYRIELVLSALFHVARTFDMRLADRLLVRMLEAWSEWPSPVVDDSGLREDLIEHVIDQLRVADRAKEFGLLQTKLAFANHAALGRFFDVVPMSLRLRAKEALVSWQSSMLPLEESDATHELVEAVVNEVRSRTAPLESFVRAWWGTATIETLARERSKLLAAASRSTACFDDAAARGLDSLRSYYGASLSRLLEDQSLTAYKGLLHELSASIYSSSHRAGHYHSRCVFPLLIILHQSLERAASDARRTYRSDMQLEPEKTQLPLAGAPRELSLNIEMRNAGNIDATDIHVVLYPAADQESRVSISDTDRQLAILGRGTTEVLSVNLDVKEPCDVVHLEYLVSWNDASATDRSATGTLKFVAQRAVDWAAAQVNPFTLRSVSSPERLCGREKELANLKRGVLGAHSYFLTGERRVGKTSIARVLTFDLRNTSDICGIYVPLGELSTQSTAAFVQRLFETVYDASNEIAGGGGTECECPPPEEFADDPIATGARVMRRLEKATPGTKYAIVLDDFDELPSTLYRGPEGDALFLLLRSLIDRGNVSLLFVGSERLPGIMRFQGERMNQVRRINLDYLADRSAMADLLRGPSRGVLEFPDESVDRIHALSSGNPFYATKIAVRTYEDMVARQDHYVSLGDVNRNVEALMEEDDVTSYQHFWKEGVLLEGPDLERMQQANAFILIALSELERETHGVGRKELLEHSLLSRIDHAVVEHRLNNLVERRVVRQEDDVLLIRVPLFRRWLQGTGATEVRASFGPRDTHYVFAPVERGVSDSDVVEVARDLVYQDKEVNEVRVRAWLAQFGGANEQRIAFKLLHRLVTEGYFNPKLIHSAYKTVHAWVVGDLAGESKWAQEVEKRRITNVFVTHFGREGKSGSALLYGYRIANQTHHSLAGTIVEAADYLRGLEKRGVVVFVDDLIGSGQTCRDGIEAFREECEAKGVLLADHAVYVATLAGIRTGIDYARQACPKITTFAYKEIGPEQRAFSPNAAIFESEPERHNAEALCRTIGEQLEPKQPLGYDDSQALIVFPHRCPNNTLPIFYKAGQSYEGKSWIPLFPR